MIYLDHSATSPMDRSTLEAMWPYMTSAFANASSQHDAGKQANDALEAARTVIAECLNTEPASVIFTGGGTESINTAIKGVALATPKGRHIITSAIEHDAVIETCKYLERFHDFRITQIGVDKYGLIDARQFATEISSGTTLCTMQYANSEVGTVQSVRMQSDICRQHGVPFHLDAVQAAGTLSCDVKELGVDLLSLSAHKFGGPKGVGILVRNSSIFIEPLIHGGGQESGLRSGTSNVAAAVGMATALHIAETSRLANGKTLTTLRDQLINGVLKVRPNAFLTGHLTQRLPNHASFCFPGFSGEQLMLDLQSKDIAASSGTACAAGSQDPSPTLLAMGISPDDAQSAIRFSLGTENTADEITQVIAFFS